MFAAGMGIAGFALGLVSIAPTLAAALGMLAVGGAGNGLMSASGQLLFQRRVPNAVLGRVLGAASALWRVAYAASFLLGGIVIAVAGVRGVFALAGAGTLVALLPLLLLLVSRRGPERAGSPAPGD